MKTNSNSYTIIYSIVIVIVVAFLLAFVYQVLKPTQDANVALDQKKQILCSLNIRDLDNATAEADYNKMLVSEEKFHNGTIYTFKVNGKTKYVFTVKGMGLWGGINGFIAVNDDKETVYGAYFNHESETAGLGAEIKDNRKWQEQFRGKKLFSNLKHSDIALSVQKKITDPKTQVDAVTGATLTSNGVAEMMADKENGLGQYLDFLNKKQ
ncbi:MAG: FMN-binding protein [Prevotellaceae bacterium]|nr:FMN-binding protein [Prevotellaceae bacterium]